MINEFKKRALYLRKKLWVNMMEEQGRSTLTSRRQQRQSPGQTCFRNFSMILSGGQENECSASDANSARSGSWWTHVKNEGSGRPPAHDMTGCVYLRMTDGWGKSKWTAFVIVGYWHFKKPCLLETSSSWSCWHHGTKKVSSSPSERSLPASRSWSPRVVLARPWAMTLPQPINPTCKCHNKHSW